MLWSLLKILIFVVLIAAATMGAGYLIESDAGVRIAFAGWEFTLGPFQAIIVALVLLLLVWLIVKLAGLLVAVIHFLSGDETAITRYFSRNRERRGFQALADGMLALAAGDGREAIARAKRAERLLHRPELSNLLIAQAAEMTGDTRSALATYKKLLGDDRTRFVGVRGIMKQKLAEGDTATALKLAENAFALKPRHEETQDILLRLQAETSDWAGARKTLNAKLKHGTLPRNVHKRRDAVLALSEARDALDRDRNDAAQELAIEANRLSPDLIPAAVMAARFHVAQGKPRQAARVIKKAWEAEPHPDLAAAFAEIRPDEDPQARIKRFGALTALVPDHPETRMLLAELNIAAEDFPAARKALGDLPETEPTARSLTLMAAIERGMGADDSVVRGWLTRALTAPRGRQWVCDHCSAVHASWLPVCSECGGFDTLSWKPAPAGDLSLPHSAEMLPLIVGALDVKPEAASAGDDEEDEAEDQAIDAASDEMPDTFADAPPDAEPADDSAKSAEEIENEVDHGAADMAEVRFEDARIVDPKQPARKG